MRVSEGIWTCSPRVMVLAPAPSAAAGCGSDGCAFASADDAAEDGSDGCSAADFFGGVFAAAFALDAVGSVVTASVSPWRLMLVSSMVSRELPL